MARPTSRTELAEYCLRKLGHPVVQINVSDEQINDRIEEALQFYQDFHYDAVERTFLKHEVTQDDIDNGYIPIIDAIQGVVRVLPFSSSQSSSSQLFDLRYQMRLNELYNFSSVSLLNYSMAMSHISLIEQMFVGEKIFRFHRHLNKLYIDMDWSAQVQVGEFIVVDCYRIIDPVVYTDVFDDMFLKKYSTALLKKQWGQNLLKFEGIQLAGGVTMNGRQLYDDAVVEIEKLEEEIDTRYSLPPDFQVG